MPRDTARAGSGGAFSNIYNDRLNSNIQCDILSFTLFLVHLKFNNKKLHFGLVMFNILRFQFNEEVKFAGTETGFQLKIQIQNSKQLYSATEKPKTLNVVKNKHN